MMPRRARLRHGSLISGAVRRGERAGTPRLVVHRVRPASAGDGPAEAGAAGARVRLAVVSGRAVGGAVVRNAVRRRLWHAARESVAAWPPGDYVVRALPPAAASDYAVLEQDLRRAVHRLDGARARAVGHGRSGRRTQRPAEVP